MRMLMRKFLKKFAHLMIISTVAILPGACTHKTVVTKPEISSLPALAIIGQWKTIDDETQREKSIIEIYEIKGKFYGKIVQLLQAEDKGKICDKCEGEDRNKPILGLVVLKDICKDEDEYSGGTILDPNNGKVYKCTIELLDNGKKIKLRGYLGFSLIGRTQYWYRVK